MVITPLCICKVLCCVLNTRLISIFKIEKLHFVLYAAGTMHHLGDGTCVHALRDLADVLRAGYSCRPLSLSLSHTQLIQSVMIAHV